MEVEWVAPSQKTSEHLFRMTVCTSGKNVQKAQPAPVRCGRREGIPAAGFSSKYRAVRCLSLADAVVTAFALALTCLDGGPAQTRDGGTGV